MIDDIDDIPMDNWNAAVAEASLPRNNLLIVDSLNLAMRYKHKGVTDFAGEFVKTINSFGKSYRSAKILVLGDYKGSSYRKEIHPKYKYDRKQKFKDQTEEEKAAAAQFFEDFERAFELCKSNFEVIRQEGVEADDLATFFVEAFEDGEVFDHIWLLSTDQDWDMLLGENVSRFAYTSRREFIIDCFYDAHGCDTPEEFASMKAIMGDLGDSVYGVPGIGAKRAYGLVRQYGSALDLANALPLEGKQQYILALNESEEKLLLNTQLVDLRAFHREAIVHKNPENLVELEKIVEKFTNG